MSALISALISAVRKEWTQWCAVRAYRHAVARSRRLYGEHRALGNDLVRALDAERRAGERMDAVLNSNN